MTKAGKKLISAAQQARLDALIAEQQAYEHAIKTGEIKRERTPLNSTPAQYLDEDAS
ncbi:hypothetical protein G9X67_34830 [Rhizobium sp. WYCCWR 11152]|uniref:hypothetical protein n=1 Tax=Rhizobium sp. WYCCWR 11152 TaxID=2692316 RepID=UPI001492004F|nr:hypothetical protein [Rhizobium sp. WYCCWR 11152]NNU70429.1 hypothetical protein [Rhizobium sp. WYCCWR 11152]